MVCGFRGLREKACVFAPAAMHHALSNVVVGETGAGLQELAVQAEHLSLAHRPSPSRRQA